MVPLPVRPLRRVHMERGSSSDPLVSIVTPTLDRGATIARCLESVRGQSYPHVEHIVVDGGSTDETLSVLAEHEGTYQLRWVSEADTGMYDAVNKGLGMARGSVVAYLNSDDLFLPWTVESALGAFDDSTDLVFGDLLLLIDDGVSDRVTELRFYPDFNMPYYLYVGSVAQPTAFWRRSLVERIGQFDESFRLIADCDYWLRAASVGAQISHVDEILAIQVDHPGTLRATLTEELDKEFGKLRSSYGSSVRPPWWHRLSPLPEKLAWRRDLLRFRHELGRDRPGRWNHLIGFLRDEGIHVEDRALLLSMLPQKMRARDRQWLDGESVLRALPGGAQWTT